MTGSLPYASRLAAWSAFWDVHSRAGPVSRAGAGHPGSVAVSGTAGRGRRPFGR